MAPSFVPTVGALSVPVHAAHGTHGPSATAMGVVVAGGFALAAVAAQLRHAGAVSPRTGRAGLALGLAVALLAAATALRALVLP